jgi:DNA-directed RNA polymerase subunit RPC12/RpoP
MLPLFIIIGFFLITFIVNSPPKNFVCKKCDTSVHKNELESLDKYEDVRTYEDHGGTDVGYYRKRVLVYKCPQCSNDLVVDKI